MTIFSTYLPKFPDALPSCLALGQKRPAFQRGRRPCGRAHQLGALTMRVKRMMAVAALLSLITAGHAWADEQSPLGLWQSVDDDTKQPSGWFLVAEHDG